MHSIAQFLALMLVVHEDVEELVANLRRQIEDCERPERDELLATTIEGLGTLACNLAAEHRQQD